MIDRYLYCLFVSYCHWHVTDQIYSYTSLSDILDLSMNSGVLHPLMAGKRETQVEIIFSVIL